MLIHVKLKFSWRKVLKLSKRSLWIEKRSFRSKISPIKVCLLKKLTLMTPKYTTLKNKLLKIRKMTLWEKGKKWLVSNKRSLIKSINKKPNSKLNNKKHKEKWKNKWLKQKLYKKKPPNLKESNKKQQRIMLKLRLRKIKQRLNLIRLKAKCQMLLTKFKKV